MSELKYLSGFKNHFESEAIPGALPKGQNSPQIAPMGLYAEQLTGTAFTAPRSHNLKTWLYKTRPSVVQGAYTEIGHSTWISSEKFGKVVRTPAPLRFSEFPYFKEKKNFWSGLYTYALNSSAESHAGCALHLYACNESMTDTYGVNADAEMMIIPQEGELLIKTEMGNLEVSPLWIAVIPRGVKFQVQLKSDKARGYMCENFGSPFQQPELGPIGANGLANTRDFESPTAAFEDKAGNFTLLTRYLGATFSSPISYSPLNAVAWHGNCVPYRYDLTKFNTMNTVSYDHPDPSIFTVLTSPSAIPGTANIDFVIFPPRWMVAENTFRPPYFHRNIMNEFMGLIQGHYDAKPDGFVPAGASLHNCMTGHGPDAEAFQKASNTELKPDRYKNTMAFMWESNLAFMPTAQVLESNLNQKSYAECWQSLPNTFSGSPKK